MPSSTPVHLFTPETQCSTYKPLESSDDSGDETIPGATSSREKLNKFLSSKDISPIRSNLNKRWHFTNERTKRHNTRKVPQAVHTVIGRNCASIYRWPVGGVSVIKRNGTSVVNGPRISCWLITKALTECYDNAGHRGTRQQILSILANKVSLKMLKRWIPSLTRYRFNIARHHQLLHGRGGMLLTEKYTRMYMGPGQLRHFLNFITSGHIIQDLPLGEKIAQVVV